MGWSTRTAYRLTTASLLLALFAAVGAQPQNGATATLDERAPNVALPTLDGGWFYLRDWAAPDSEILHTWMKKEKHVVVLSFFATWCEPCRKELPEFQELSRAYAGQPVKWRIVNAGDARDSIGAFLGRLGVETPVLLDRYRLLTPQYAAALPTTVVIDREGILRYHAQGYDESDRDAMKRVAAAVSEALGIPVSPQWEIPRPADDDAIATPPPGESD